MLAECAARIPGPVPMGCRVQPQRYAAFDAFEVAEKALRGDDAENPA